MDYARIRHQIEDGDLLAVRGRSLWSRAIRVVTASRVTHVGFACWVRDRLCVLESRECRGVQVVPLSRVLARGRAVDWYQLDALNDFGAHPLDRHRLVDFCLNQWGAGYAPWWQFVRSWGIVSRWLADLRGLPADVDPSLWFCSELCLAALQHAGYQGEGYDRPPSQAAPGDVIELPCFRRMGTLQWDQKATRTSHR